jgi:hypothetical protein
MGKTTVKQMNRSCDKSVEYLMSYKAIINYLCNVSAFECFETN